METCDLDARIRQLRQKTGGIQAIIKYRFAMMRRIENKEKSAELDYVSYLLFVRNEI